MADDGYHHRLQFLLKHVQRGTRTTVALYRVLLLRLRQSFLVYLLVLVQRDTVNLHRHSRHHVGRLLLHDEVVQLADIHLLIADDVGSDELAATRVVEGLHGDILDASVLADDGLHLFQLNAEAANLHLSVLTPDELYVAIRQVAHHVAGSVGAMIAGAERCVRCGVALEGILHKHLGSLLRTVQITARHLRTSHPQLTAGSWGQAVSALVDDVALQVALCHTDGHVLPLLRHLKLRDVADGLRRSVAVANYKTLRWNQRGQLLTARHQALQRLVLEVGGKLIGHLCGHEDMGDVVLFDVVVQGDEVQAQLLGDDVDRSPMGERAEHLHHRSVEAVAGIGADAALCGDVLCPRIHVAEGHHVAMLQLAALGHARRAAGVEHVEQAVGGGPLQLHAFGTGQRGDVACQQHVAGVFAHQRAQLLIGDEHLHPGILGHEVQALLGISGVQRLITAACLQHAERSQRHPLAARYQDGHHVFSAQTLSGEMGSEAVGDLIGLTVGILTVLVDHSRLVGIQTRLLAEQAHHGLCVVVGVGGLVERVEQLHLLGRNGGDVAQRTLQVGELHDDRVETLGKQPDERLGVEVRHIFGTEFIAVVGQEQLEGGGAVGGVAEQALVGGLLATDDDVLQCGALIAERQIQAEAQLVHSIAEREQIVLARAVAHHAALLQQVADGGVSLQLVVEGHRSGKHAT